MVSQVKRVIREFWGYLDPLEMTGSPARRDRRVNEDDAGKKASEATPVVA